MRFISSSFLLPALVLVMGISSCTKSKDGATGPAGPVGPAGPSYIGAISGHVSLFDQYGSKVLTGLGNVYLAFDGYSTVAVDSSGYYIKGSVGTGSYSISASNTGYGATHVNSFQFLADTLNRDVKLSAIPAFAPTSVTATALSGADSLTLIFSADTRARNCIVFLNKGTAAGSTPDKYLLVYTKAIPANSTRPVFINIPAQDLANAGFTTGQTVYVAGYGYVVGDASAYEDLATGKTVYTAVSATPVTTTFTAP